MLPSRKATEERLQKLEAELAELRERADALKAQWQNEKDVIAKIRQVKEQIDAAKIEQERAERAGDLQKAAELRYGTMLKLQKQLEEENARLTELQKSSKMLKEEVDEEDIAEVVAKWTGIPVTRLLEGEMQKLLQMEDRLRRRVVGQEEALRIVSDAVRRARAGLQDPNRPIGSFIFLGPTGVGKTELARALADFLFDDERAMVRIDMSEYMEKHTVSRLIGAPPGYVGYDEGGQLTEAVRRRPYAVLLFDEIEKAHGDVFNVLLQLLDEGRLTDGHGRTVDFRNTVVIMTSNLATEIIYNLLSGRDGAPARERIEREVWDILKAHFRPEFLNRIDQVVTFNPLGDEELKQIVDIQLQSLRARLADRRLELKLTDAAKRLIAREGFDPQFGARPIKRAIQRLVQDPLARELLAGRLAEGEIIEADVAGAAEDEVVFRH